MVGVSHGEDSIVFFIFRKKIPKRDFLSENKKDNAPLAMGVPSHDEGSIFGFSMPLTARVYLAVTGIEKRLFDRPSKLGGRSNSHSSEVPYSIRAGRADGRH